ncbi:hypothetical protein QA639_09795 [Bradyrhizobium pachyrhizi]|uniref:hypothetical protein n=1 Tax=Bradyrhizobium pachyrhizi TaxID=280333 RepID=UPI0024B09908|nr:hypothetical protein [Bradyrhizobium pachyrhizi]WFU57767.1 hypothetical protein QA639_09795 [Bradyrhizobium pachyrhizi]
MKKRRRFKQTETLQERLAKFAAEEPGPMMNQLPTLPTIEDPDVFTGIELRS